MPILKATLLGAACPAPCRCLTERAWGLHHHRPREQKRIACGEGIGPQVRRIGAGLSDSSARPTLMGTRCASVNACSLYANTKVPALHCDQLECLIPLHARGTLALERLAGDTNGDLVSIFTKPWSEGTIGIRVSPLRLLETLAVLLPLSRTYLVRYGGVSRLIV
jgi:hypothetical protein